MDELVAGYRAGRSLPDLAKDFGVHRRTVAAHLEQRGVQRRVNSRKMSERRHQRRGASLPGGRLPRHRREDTRRSCGNGAPRTRASRRHDPSTTRLLVRPRSSAVLAESKLVPLLDEMAQQDGAVTGIADLPASSCGSLSAFLRRRLAGLHRFLVRPDRAHATPAARTVDHVAPRQEPCRCLQPRQHIGPEEPDLFVDPRGSILICTTRNGWPTRSWDATTSATISSMIVTETCPPTVFIASWRSLEATLSLASRSWRVSHKPRIPKSGCGPVPARRQATKPLLTRKLRITLSWRYASQRRCSRRR